MKIVKVNLGAISYKILIGRGILAKLKTALKKLKLGKAAIIVTNPTISRLYARQLKAVLKAAGLEVHFKQVPDSEQSKSAKICIALLESLADLDKGKGIFVVALGGGVIGDLAGFAASVYRRGVPYIQVPTTLLAQVDSSIGGKVAIDLPCGKNLVGSFYQPRLVLADTRFLRSLHITQIKQALAEIIKYALIADKRFFQYLERHLQEILASDQMRLQYVIEVCAKIKAKIVAEDELDKKGKRAILNFGHTTGHALEAAAGYARNYPHGYSVALGMLVACEMARQLRQISAKDVQRIERLIAQAGLPTKISELNLNDILKALANYMKFSGGKNLFVLPVRIGKVAIRRNIPQKIIAQAIKSRMA